MAQLKAYNVIPLHLDCAKTKQKNKTKQNKTKQNKQQQQQQNYNKKK